MRSWAFAAVAVLMTAAFVTTLQVSALSDFAVTVVSNGVQLLAAVLASAGCAIASFRGQGQRRRAWLWLSAGTGSWAAGQVVWSYYEVVIGREVPFPSIADIGFLAFPVVGGVGLLIWSAAQGHQALARGRDLMDGAIVAVSLAVLSWVMVMAPIVEASGGFDLSLVLSLAYPLGDVVLGTLVLIILFRSQSERMTLTLLAFGLGGFALADSLFVYLTSRGTYSSADLVSSGGWVFGFLFLAASAMSVSRGAHAPEANDPRSKSGSTWLWLAVPYLPLVGAGAALSVDLLKQHSSALADLVLGVGLVSMVLTRQFLAMIDNQRLLTALAEAGGQLEHQATHDALTGLPNRTLFAKRLDRALLASSSNVDVLFCDLDNFKDVNDELGHGAGDLLLKIVADRLLECVRAGDTVARLGGDEFAVLLQDCPDAREVADRIVASMQTRAEVLGRQVGTSISVGVARHEGGPRPTSVGAHRLDALDVAASEARAERQATAALLIRLADTAMYAAKSAGKGRAAVLEADPILTPVGN
jgi:diguanylate cyclase (GGDEF)-like protein